MRPSAEVRWCGRSASCHRGARCPNHRVTPPPPLPVPPTARSGRRGPVRWALPPTGRHGPPYGRRASSWPCRRVRILGRAPGRCVSRRKSSSRTWGRPMSHARSITVMPKPRAEPASRGTASRPHLVPRRSRCVVARCAKRTRCASVRTPHRTKAHRCPGAGAHRCAEPVRCAHPRTGAGALNRTGLVRSECAGRSRPHRAAENRGGAPSARPSTGYSLWPPHPLVRLRQSRTAPLVQVLAHPLSR